MKAEITACGEDALYNEIEFPLAQVLADMTRTGVLVDKDGIEQFGVTLREELEQVLTRIHMETGSASSRSWATRPNGHRSSCGS